MKASIGGIDKEIAFSELGVVPSFLRFGNVLLYYQTGLQSIVQKCESFRDYLPSIKASLYDSNKIHFVCVVGDDEDLNCCFNDSTLIEHICLIMSICDSSRGYTFLLLPYSNSDEDADMVGNAFGTILEIPAISHSSQISIDTLLVRLTQLPIEIVSNWLNRERHEMDQKQRERNLQLGCQVPNAAIQEMCDFLKQVFSIFEYLSLNFFTKHFRYERIHLKNSKFAIKFRILWLLKLLET